MASVANETLASIGNDSDEEEEDDNNTSTTTQEDDDDDEAPSVPLGEHWSDGIFHPKEDPGSLFKEHFTSTCRSGVVCTEMQVPASYCNSPIKAWRQIFTISILEKIACIKSAAQAAPDWAHEILPDMTDFIRL